MCRGEGWCYRGACEDKDTVPPPELLVKGSTHSRKALFSLCGNELCIGRKKRILPFQGWKGPLRPLVWLTLRCFHFRTWAPPMMGSPYCTRLLWKWGWTREGTQLLQLNYISVIGKLFPFPDRWVSSSTNGNNNGTKLIGIRKITEDNACKTLCPGWQTVRAQ